MKRATRVFLIAGCAVVFALELPAAVSCLVAGWRGPYSDVPSTPRTVAGDAAIRTLAPGAVGCLGLRP